MTLQQIFGETNNGPTTFADIRNAYSEFDEIADEFPG